MMVKIRIDGKHYEVEPGKNLLETCLSLGINVPHFCYHPALGSVGACRLCAVKKFKDDEDKRGRIVMSCMEPVVEGLIISVEDKDARSFRASVIESLMINHPHDCPVCDEGGECHLQDMTIMSGHVYRRYDFPKRTYKNQELGPFINHEMNRCIQCYRCVRFYRDYAGGTDLNVFASRNQVYFGRHEDGDLENEFSGNLAEVCPTGVFTDKTLRKHYTRKWDLTNSPSVCVHCSVGCNIIASQRYGTMRRIMNRYNGEVNGFFICDRGRFGYEFVNDSKRIHSAEIRAEKKAPLDIADDSQIISAFNSSADTKIIGIGSPRATLESNFALMTLTGKENFYHGISEREHRLTAMVADYFLKSGIHNASLKEMEKADVILILGEDLTNTAPMMALAVRQAARNLLNAEAEKDRIPLWNDLPVRELGQNFQSGLAVATPFFDALDRAAGVTFRGSYSEIAELGYSVASEIKGKKSGSKSLQELSENIASSLKNAKNPLIVSGVNNGDEKVVQAALNLASVLRSAGANVMLGMALTECNSMGLALMPGRSFEELLNGETKPVDKLLIIENDLFRRTSHENLDELFARSNKVVVFDHLMNNTAENADILLPASPFTESEGTIVNYEGRAQRYYKAIENNNQVKETWRWITELMDSEAGKGVSWKRVDDILEALAKQLPVFSKLRNYIPDADFRVINTKVPRQTFRFSGRTAMTANIAVSEPKPPQDPDSPLAFSMEGLPENPPSSLVPFYWTPGWNSVQSLYKKYTEEPDSSLKGGDPGIKLFETKLSGDIFFNHELNKTTLKKGEFLIFPFYQIFGSEELSSASASVRQKISTPFMLISREDADQQKLTDGDMVELEVSGRSLNVKVRTGQGIRQGMAAVSVNLPGMQALVLPGTGKFHRL
jgi:NADH-quinone oxidoreductase subunit G